MSRIEEVAARRLVEKFSAERNDGSVPRDAQPDQRRPSVRAEGDRVVVGGDDARVLTREAARDLRAALGDALTERREFVRTAGTHREDGAYVVERRGAESSGHRKVFDDFAECRRLYGRLPDEFTADDVRHAGVTGARRHMLVWHFAEHDVFDCDLVARQPLTARKRGDDGGDADG